MIQTLQNRFNRYIVECKDNHFYKNSFQKIDLIDTLWNVKKNTLIFVVLNFHDLIDTLWNVKIICLCLCSPLHNDLIDTLWNVKQGHTAAFSLTAGFNRYIVECKGIYLAYTGS